MILLDTGPIVALFDPTDAYRAAVTAVLPTLRGTIAIPQPVLGELGYFLGSRLRPAREASALRQLSEGTFALEPAELSDFSRASELVHRYADFPLGTVDALIVAMAERLGVTTLFTLDRRHFGAVKPEHCERFVLVP